MMSISAGELVVCCNSSAARKLKRAKNPGKSGTSTSPRSPPRKNARDAVAKRLAPHAKHTFSSKRDVATANDSIIEIAEHVRGRAPPVICHDTEFSCDRH